MGIAWDKIVEDGAARRLELRTSESALAQKKAAEAGETVQTRLREAWCYLMVPHQDSLQSDVSFHASRIPSQDGVLSHASKKLVADEALLPEIGPVRLNRELEKTIWADKPHLSLKELWVYLNRYTYLPRLKERDTLVKAVKGAISGQPGPFAYAERWNAETKSYEGLVMENAPHALVVIDSASLIVRPDVPLPIDRWRSPQRRQSSPVRRTRRQRSCLPLPMVVSHSRTSWRHHLQPLAWEQHPRQGQPPARTVSGEP